MIRLSVINQSIIDMVKNEDTFKSTFDEAKKRQVTVNKSHTFDSRQTVVTVGPNNSRFPFDTEDPLFAMSDINVACLKAQGQKIKQSLVTAENCYVCRKPKADWPKKKAAQCEFCAQFGCIECINQTFPFP